MTTSDTPKIDPYTLPWVTGAADTLPNRILHAYPDGPSRLAEALKHLRSKRARNGADPRPYTYRTIGRGASPAIEDYDDPAGRS